MSNHASEAEIREKHISSTLKKMKEMSHNNKRCSEHDVILSI